MTEEIDRAISYGLVREELQGDYGGIVTFRQYSEMPTNLICLWDEGRLDEWEETIALAAESDEEMQREDARPTLWCSWAKMRQGSSFA